MFEERNRQTDKGERKKDTQKKKRMNKKKYYIEIDSKTTAILTSGHKTKLFL